MERGQALSYGVRVPEDIDRLSELFCGKWKKLKPLHSHTHLGNLLLSGLLTSSNLSSSGALKLVLPTPPTGMVRDLCTELTFIEPTFDRGLQQREERENRITD